MKIELLRSEPKDPSPPHLLNMTHTHDGVYFARCADTPWVKIGHSKYPWFRVQTELQAGNPFHLNMLGIVWVLRKPKRSAGQTAKTLEGILHSVFSDLRGGGEWFNIFSEPEAVAAMKNVISWAPVIAEDHPIWGRR